MFRKQSLISFGKAFFIIAMLVVFNSSCSTHKSYSHAHRTYKSNKKKRNTKKYVSRPHDKQNQLRNRILGTAKKYMGTKYVYGGKKPPGFDCSGFITWVMNKNGIKINGSSSMIAKLGKKKSLKSLKKGDLVFFGKGSKVTHIAMVVENDEVLKVIHSTSSRGVVIDEISSSKYWKKKYLFGKSVI